jgi:hypothetical protein
MSLRVSAKPICRLMVAGASLLVPLCVLHAAPSTADDRIVLSLNGSSLTGTNGGGGGSLGWLHNFDSDTLIGLGAQHQVLSVSHWTFGSLTGSLTRGQGDQRYTVYGQADLGAGDDGGKAFKYRVGTLGLTGTYFHRLSATLEDKQVNVEDTHGNLPKVQLAYLWNPRFQTTVGYQHSIGGNLGTRLTTARIDVYTSSLNFLAGAAIGQASPSLLGTLLTLPPRDLREGYVGVTKSFPSIRGDLTLIADYQRLSGGQGSVTVTDPTTGIGTVTYFPIPVSQRWTGTLNYTFHIGHRGT